AEIWMAAVVDEEFSCQGVLRLCEGLTASAAVVAEPTEMRLVIASKGVLRWRIVSYGRSAHSSKIHLGFNAIHPMARLLIAIEEEHSQLGRLAHPLLGASTANVGMIAGGVQVNFVPDQCAIEIDRRLLPFENVEDVLASYQRRIDCVASAIPGARLEMEKPMLIDRGLDTSPNARIVQAAGRVLRHMGENPEPSGVAFGSDASKLMLAGVDSILFGPGSIDQAHGAVEYVELEQVQRAEQFYYTLIREFGE
ncbi:MAG: M20 family metallopeptidase, partial [Planctomycetes bacterium]|nr:M20 family metallopeptidase [Planctomycetota bacterium]